MDLTVKTSRTVALDPSIYARHVGGKGLAGYFLKDCGALEWDSPDMPLLLMTGPLVGTRAPTSGRMTIASRSPQTGTIGDASVGGKLGTALKRAGFDGIVLTGVCDNWIGLEIVDNKVSFADASPLLGLPLGRVADQLKDKGSIAAIGIAAENGVLFSGVMVDRHYCAARGGLGLTFAAKRLKYITVAGTGNTSVHDPLALDRAREEIHRQVAATSILKGAFGIENLGTPALYDLMHARRMMPTANFSRTWFADAPALNANALRKRYGTKKFGCNGCHILCKKKGSGGEHIPEFETLSHFTALIENSDLAVAVQANQLCNEYGMDTISAAVTLACHAELRGYPLSGTEVLDLLDAAANRRGIGEQLAMGSARYAAAMGAPHLSMSVKGLELPAYDPRGAYGMALAYATSTRGGCHLRAYPIGHEILRRPVSTDRFSFAGKARIIKIAEDRNALIDSLTACKFVFFASTLEEYAKAYTAVTGLDTDATELSLTGERIYYQEKVTNAQWGFSAQQDDLPPRFFLEPGTSGPGLHVPPIDRSRFLAARGAYYHVRGLDEAGFPTAETVRKLGLS